MNFQSLVLLFFFCSINPKVFDCSLDIPERSLGTFAVEQIIERIQTRMRNGFSLIGIPPLAPLKLTDRNLTLNLAFMKFNSTLSNNLIDGIDLFHINYVKFSLRDKSMNFSLTFSHLKANGSYAGCGNFVKYIPMKGIGNYSFDIYNMTTNIEAFVTFSRFRMQIANVTATSTMDNFKSNVTGLNNENRWPRRSVNKLMNRLIEIATFQIFNLNQRLFNYSINNIVVPRVNKILTMFSVARLSGTDKSSNDVIQMTELDDESIKKFIKDYPNSFRDKQIALNKIFHSFSNGI